jgi:spermidine synthase
VDGAPLRVGVIGLGAGTLAAYGQAGDRFRFYELNPQVEWLARREFSYLKNTPATVEMVLGDGRLSLEREAPQNFDVLVVDAFSGDSVPVHLLSTEALAVYRRHLKADGWLALHVSNTVLDLVPVARSLAPRQATHLNVKVDDTIGRSESDWVLIGNLPPALLARGQALRRPLPRPWTDDHHDLLGILK